MENRHIMVRQRLLIQPLEAPDFGHHIVAQHRPVEGAARNIPSEHCRVVEVLSKVRAIDEQFLRNATADHASPADLMFLGDGDLRAMRRRHPRRANSARPGADHDQIIMRHQRPARSSNARVDASDFSRCSGSSSSRASRLPSSTPN